MPLVLVATPIGNLGDLSPRAAEALRGADCICCEDTRRTGKLLELSGVGRRAGVPLVRVDDHTEAAAIGSVLARLRAGETVVVVTDAGTPGIADPGERLVRAVAAEGLPVTVVPGPSALVAGLVGSGLPTGRFVFEGFLPRRGSARAARLAALAREERTVVLYESPHRLATTLTDVASTFGADRRVVVARELTKLHEEFVRCPAAEAAAWAASAPVLGEVVVVVEGAPPAAGPSAADVDSAVASALAAGLSVRDAAASVAEELGVGRRVAYEAATRLRST